MTTHADRFDFVRRPETSPLPAHGEALRWLAPIGRLSFALIFIMATGFHFSDAAVAYAAAQGLPRPEVLVPLAGVLSLLGGLSVMFGYRTRVGAVMLILFLVPVTLVMHRFWAVRDPTMMQMQVSMFMKNVALLGGALLLAYFGPGPVSMDAHVEARPPRS